MSYFTITYGNSQYIYIYIYIHIPHQSFGRCFRDMTLILLCSKLTILQLIEYFNNSIHKSRLQNATASTTTTTTTFLFGRNSLKWARASSFTRFLDHRQRCTTVGRTPLEEWSARRRDLYLTIHNTHNRKASMPPAGFEPTISAGQQP